MRATPYAGLVTRAFALTVDALVINVIAVITGAVIALIGSLLGVGNLGIAAALTGGVLWLTWTGLYFISFWVLTGQTPGARLLGIRVVSDSPRPLGVVRASLRFIVMLLALVPLGAGYVTVLFDERRRGPHDMVAATVARWASPADDLTLTESPAPARAPAPAFAPAGSAATPLRPAPAPVTTPGPVTAPSPATAPPPAASSLRAAAPPPATSPRTSATAPPPATSPRTSATAPPPASFPPPAPAAPRAQPQAAAPAQTARLDSPSPPVVGEVVGPARDDHADGRVPPSGWDRPR